MKTLLAYSGGLDTSCILLWLQQHLNHEVTCIYADIGIDEDHKKVEEKARKMGAKDFIYLDLKNEFADEYLVALIRSGARYQNKYLLGTAIARPLIAKKIAQTADQLKVDHIAHGATGKETIKYGSSKPLATLSQILIFYPHGKHGISKAEKN